MHRCCKAALSTAAFDTCPKGAALPRKSANFCCVESNDNVWGVKKSPFSRRGMLVEATATGLLLSWGFLFSSFRAKKKK